MRRSLPLLLVLGLAALTPLYLFGQAEEPRAAELPALPLDVQLEDTAFLYEEPSHSSSSVALLRPRARLTLLETAPQANLGSIWWLVETEDVRPKRTVRGYLQLFLPDDLRNPTPEILQALEQLTEQAREQQFADYLEAHRQRYWQARERLVSRDDAPPLPGVPRDRCDGVSPEESALYDDAPVVELRHVLRPRSTFTEHASVECRQSGTFDEGRKIHDYQIEFGSKDDLRYRIDYADGSGSVYQPAEGAASDTLWSLQCAVDSMDDSRRCHLRRGALSVVFLGEGQWLVFVGGADNYPGSEIAIRFGEDEPLRDEEPSFSGDTAARIAETLEAEGRVRLRYLKWPSGIGEEDFEARGFRAAKQLMLWAFDALAP